MKSSTFKYIFFVKKCLTKRISTIVVIVVVFVLRGFFKLFRNFKFGGVSFDCSLSGRNRNCAQVR